MVVLKLLVPTERKEGAGLGTNTNMNTCGILDLLSMTSHCPSIL
jgi:hypothetical protein